MYQSKDLTNSKEVYTPKTPKKGWFYQLHPGNIGITPGAWVYLEHIVQKIAVLYGQCS